MINPFDHPITYAPKIEDILYWVAEREEIRERKTKGFPSASWTGDPILQKYRFCNVRRRDDRMTKWMCDNMFTPYTYNEETDLWFVSAIARYVNWPPTLYALLANGAIPSRAEEFDPDCFVMVMDDLKEEGLKVWGSAYMIYPSREKGANKAETVAYRFLLPLVEGAEKIRETVASNRVSSVVEELVKYYGWNTFLAGQVAADLSYYDLKDAEDLYTWAPMGPGSQRGLNRLNGAKLNHQWRQEPFNEQLIHIREEICEQLDLDEFTLHDTQNCMCEIDKYWRVLASEGSPRSVYVPETAY